MLLFAGVSVLQMIPKFVLVLSTCMRSIISKKNSFEKMTYRMVLAVCGSYTICAIIILRGPWGSKRTCLCAVYSVVAVTCMQGHEHQSTMSAKVVADYKIHIRDVRWAWGQFLRVGWQGGRQEGLFVVGY